MTYIISLIPYNSRTNFRIYISDLGNLLWFIAFNSLQFCVHSDKKKMLPELTRDIHQSPNKEKVVSELAQCIASGMECSSLYSYWQGRIKVCGACGILSGWGHLTPPPSNNILNTEFWKIQKSVCINSWIEKSPVYTFNVIGITIQLGW
jgi:hypothetical protein